MNPKFYFIAIVLILTSCAKKIMPIEGYNQINNKKAANLSEAYKSIAKQIKVNEDYKSELTLNDSILSYNDSLKSNYKKFKFKTKPEKEYKIKVSSLCNCSGFKKYIFIPKIISESANYKFSIKSDSTYFNYEKGPLTLNKVWEIKYDELKGKTELKFLLLSDNSKLSEKIYKFIINPIGFIPINIKSTLIGKFFIKIEEY